MITANSRPTSADGYQLTAIYSAGTARVYRNYEWDEYIVAVDGSPWLQWYHTDDLDDAKATAHWCDISARKDTARVMREVTG